MTDAPAGNGVDDDGTSAWTLTLTHGKQTFAVPFESQHHQRVTLLKREVERVTGVASKYQRLLYRGKELREEGDSHDDSTTTRNAAAKTPPSLINNAKIMLLLNQTFHEEVAQRRAVPLASAVGSADTLTQASAPVPAAKQTAIELDSLDSSEVLVQASRGKASYEFVSKREDAVLAVKQRISAIIGLPSAHSIRLVVKGKTPADDTALSELLLGTSTSSSGSGSAQTLKCMVLLHAHQHVVMEKEDELRLLLNELTQLSVDARRVETQVARNFAAREEMTIRVTALVDSAQRVRANLELLLAHLRPSGSAALAKPRASEQTAAVLVQAIVDAQALSVSCQTLLQRVTLQ